MIAAKTNKLILSVTGILGTVLGMFLSGASRRHEFATKFQASLDYVEIAPPSGNYKIDYATSTEELIDNFYSFGLTFGDQSQRDQWCASLDDLNHAPKKPGRLVTITTRKHQSSCDVWIHKLISK